MAGYIYLLETQPIEDSSPFLLAVPKRKHFEFQLQACSNAFVDLFADNTELFKYRFIIGAEENTQLELWDSAVDSTNPVKEMNIADLLKCTQYRTFWIGWENGLIRLGMGKYLEQVLLEYTATSEETITRLTVGEQQNKQQQMAKWQFPVVSGKNKNLF